MILGSHNTFTYLPAKKWWMKIIPGIGKCQEVNYETQYADYGVRLFDLRVRFDKHGKLVVCHGLAEYKMSKDDVIDFLSFLDYQGDSYCRVELELRSKSKDESFQKDCFKAFCTEITNLFPNVKFIGGDVMYSGENAYKFENSLAYEEMHASVCSPKIIDDWYPKYYAKRNNHTNIENFNGEALMIDFVNIQ